MKKVNFIITCIAALIFAACGNNPSTGTKTEGDGHEHHDGDGHDHGAEGHEGHTHQTYFTCIDHQDVHEHAAGKCPKCSMELVEKKGDKH